MQLIITSKKKKKKNLKKFFQTHHKCVYVSGKKNYKENIFIRKGNTDTTLFLETKNWIHDEKLKSCKAMASKRLSKVKQVWEKYLKLIEY
jgi:hypothetical protein